MEENKVERETLKGLIGGTIDGVGGDPALAILANFVNGVRLAQVDADIARRLSDVAEVMVRGELNPDADEIYIRAVELIREADAAAASAPA